VALNPAPRPDGRAGRRPAVDGWLLAASLADQVSQTADSFLLGGLVGVRAAGVYGAVYRLPNAGTTVLGLLTGVLIARMAGILRDQPHRSRAELARSLRASVAAAVLVLLLAPVARALVVPLLGAQYSSGRDAAALLFVGLALVCAGAPLHASVLASHRDRAYVTGLVGAATLNVLANLLLIPPLHLTGAALATVLSSGALTAYLAVIVVRAGAGQDGPSPVPVGAAS